MQSKDKMWIVFSNEKDNFFSMGSRCNPTVLVALCINHKETASICICLVHATGDHHHYCEDK